MLASSHKMVRDKMGLKLSVMVVGNWDISSMNAQANRQADLMLMV